MAIIRKAVLAALASVPLVGGCASGPYYDGYDYGYDRYGYYDSPAYGHDYAHPGYVAPSIGLGLAYSDREYRRNREWRGDNRDWRRDDRDRRRDDPAYRHPRDWHPDDPARPRLDSEGVVTPHPNSRDYSGG